MEIPQATLDRFKVASELTTLAVNRQTERGELLKQFLEQINLSRIGSHYKPVSIAKIGMDVAHIETKDLYYLLSTCKDAGNRAKRYDSGFAKMFYWSIRVQKDAKT
jgi:hypothetical protein